MKNPVTKFLFCLYFFLFASVLFAQKAIIDSEQPQARCGAADLQARILESNPQAKKAWLQLEEAAYLATKQASQGQFANYTLPIVIHVIHDNGSENLTDAEIFQGVQHLNDAFANINYYDQGTGVNTNFEFCLARRAPDGTATSGINRIQSPLTHSTIAEELDLKNLSRWDPLNYINIWLVRELCIGTVNCSLAGYANFPARHGLDDDGIVMEARWFGSSNGNSGVQIHEMGHYLGLYHTFQGGCTNNVCALDGDRVCDTPPDNSTTVVPCGGSANSCSTDTNSGFSTDQDDMYWNYMDYGDWDCYSAFTQGQTNRMTFFIENARNSLLLSEGCNDPCPISADLSIDSAPTQVQVGTTVTFTLTAPMLTQFEWFINNVSVGTGPSLTYTFTDKGTYNISVEGGNGNPLCAGFDFTLLEVICPVEADFTASAAQIFVSESVLFTSTSTNATSLSWYIDGVLVSSATSFSETFTEEGNHEVVLVAENNICADTTEIFYVFVVHPCGQGGTKLIQTQGFRPSQLRKLADGGLIVIYRSNIFQPYQVTRLDSDQNLVWVKTVTSGDQVRIHDVVEDPIDNGFLLCGFIDELGEELGYIFKLDANGNYLWGHKTTLGDRSFKYIYPAPGGDYLVAGAIKNIPNDSTQIVKIRTDGTLLWSKTYYGIGLVDFEVMTDGSLYVSGQLEFYPSGFSSAGLAHLDSDGNVLWSSRYRDPLLGMAFHSRLSTMTENDVGGVVIGYSVQDDTFKKFDVLVSLDSNGDILWQKKYYYGYQRMGYETEGPVEALIQTPDGGYVFYSSLSNALLSVLTKVDAQGELLWSRNLSPVYNFTRFGSPRIEILDNGNMVVGHNGRLFILDPNGLLGPCPLTDIQSEIYPIDLLKEVANMAENTNLSFVSAAATTSDGSFNPSVSCETQTATQPDAEVSTIDAGLCNGIYTLNWQVCNTGTGVIPNGTPYTLYDGNPTTTAASMILNQTLSTDLTPGDCRTLQSTIPSLPANQVNIVFNDDGSLAVPFDLTVDLAAAATLIECNFFNNLDSLSLDNLPVTTPLPFLGLDTIICSSTNLPLRPGLFSSYHWQDGSTNDSLIATAPGTYSVTVTDACGATQVDNILIQWLTPPLLDLGPDISLCENAVLPLDAGPGFTSYLWSDGSKDQQITAWLPGPYMVEAMDACGGIQRDTLVITYDPGTILDLPLELKICSGSDLNISVPGYLDYQWSPAGILDCDNCADVVFTADQDRTFYLLVETAAGCFSLDSVNVVVKDTINTSDQSTFCTGDSVLVFGQWIKNPGDYSDSFSSVNGCDSVHTISVSEINPVSGNELRSICQGDSSFIFGVWEKAMGIYSDVFTSYLGCDSTHFVELQIQDTLRSNDQLSICQGDSSLIFGHWEKTAGTYSQTFATAFGCDSTHSIELILLDTFRTNDQVRICQGDSALIFGLWEKTAGLYSQTLPSAFGCDSTHAVELLLLDTFRTNEQLSICNGDSTLIFGLWEKTAGLYSQTLSSSFGCDSTHSVELVLVDTFLTNRMINICTGDSAFVFDAWENMAGTYTRTLSSSFGCDSIEVIQVLLGAAAEGAEELVICVGDSVRVFGEWVYDAGVFTASYAVAGACDSLHQISVIVEDEISLEATPEWIIAPGDSVSLQVEVLSLANVTYSWLPAAGLSCTDCRSPLASPVINTTYLLVVTDEQGCTASIEVLVRIEEMDRSIYLPTAFSPNEDLANDVLFPQGVTGTAMVVRFSIYDRWGEVVFVNENFELNAPEEGWDGTFKQKEMMAGVYVAVVEVRWEDGQTEMISGGVMLIR